MSKQRQRARATREAEQRAAARTKAAQKKAAPRETSRPAVAGSPKRKAKQPVYRARRFPPLPMWLKVSLALGWLAVQVLAFFTIDEVGTRIGLAIVSLFALPLIVVLARDPSRRVGR